MKAFFRGSVAMLVGSVALLAASSAFAAGEACTNDIDCPGGGAVCGGDVCNWSLGTNPTPVGDKTHICGPAGAAAKGTDGWCTTDADCKCKAQGAKCSVVYCTFTKASDAPAGGGGSSAGGSSAGGASSAGTTSTAGTTTSTAGTTASTAGTSSAGTGTTAAPASSDSGGGCSVSAPIGSRGGAALALGVLGLGFALSRRRR